MNRAESPRRTLRVFVPSWVIDDGSFPRASLGDTVDVLLEFARLKPVRPIELPPLMKLDGWSTAPESSSKSLTGQSNPSL